MITVNSLSIHFTGIDLFNNVSFVIGDRDRIGLVGKNGAGKSTMLKILSGELEPMQGSVVIPSDQSIGYLPQEMIPSSKVTVMQEAITAFETINKLEKALEEISLEIAERDDYESSEYEALINKHVEINERLSIMGVNNKEAEAEKILLGLGFLRTDLDRNLTEFSSGWQMRVELAKLLIQRPSFLLLDEPTNHLDIESIEWLEGFLINYYGSVILVSHDRAFLDSITDRTIEITAGKIYDYKASYSEYVELMQERRLSQASTLSNQQRQIAQIERFVERFRYKASKAKQVQSRIKYLERMDIEDVDEMDTSQIHFKFPPSPHSGRISLEIETLSKSYGDHLVLDKINMIVPRGEKVAFVGKNGEGKSTLAKIIVGEIDDYTGGLKHGHQLSIGYFAQNQAALLDGEKTVFETIDEVATGDSRPRIRTILGSFLFDSDDIEKKVKVLSGGEKTRLALAKLILSPVNCLVLDEPTNHLDMDAKDILKNALIHYDGTLILVSHDRDFLQGLTDCLYEFKNRGIREFIGDIYEYLEDRKLSDLKDLEEVSTKAVSRGNQVSESRLSYEKAKEYERELRRIRNAISRIEKEISDMEERIAEIDNKLSNPEEYEKLIAKPSFFEEYEALKAGLNQKMEEWEGLCVELEVKSEK